MPPVGRLWPSEDGDEDDGDDDDDDSHDDDDETTQTRLSARPTQGASRNLLISKLPFTTQPLTCIFVFVYLIKHFVHIFINVSNVFVLLRKTSSSSLQCP